MSTAIQTHIDELALPLVLTIDREATGGVTGLSPTVELRRGDTVATYLDWADSTFKASGWLTKSQALTEVGNGHYQATLPVAAIVGVAAGDVYVAEYSVAGAVLGAAHDIIVVADIATAVWDSIVTGRSATPDSAGRIVDLQNKMLRGRIRTNPALNRLELYDPADDALLLTWPLADFAGGGINDASGAPFDRAKATEL